MNDSTSTQENQAGENRDDYLAELRRQFYGPVAEHLGMTLDDYLFHLGVAEAAGDDTEMMLGLAVQPELLALAAEESGAPDGERDPVTWKRQFVAAHTARKAGAARPPGGRPRGSSNAKQPRRHDARRSHRSSGRRSRAAKIRSGQSPGGDDDGGGDGEPGDPVEAAVRRLVAQAPPLSPGQERRLQHLLRGGVR